VSEKGASCQISIHDSQPLPPTFRSFPSVLKLYALYKQGTKGDVSGERPGMMAFADRAKYDAWAELAGMSSDDAKQGYIDFAEELKAR
jgi:acyl-CoA-binding protein